MRALVISHACVARDNRAKWELMARDGLADVELHLPHHWPSWEHDYRPTPVEQPRFRIRIHHALRTGREDQYFFAPKFSRGLGAGNFDILHVEQGTTAFVYLQALRERNRASRKTKSCFFTWINWESRLRWPWTAVERFTLHHSEGAICGNGEAADILRRHGFRGKTAVIPQLGVDTDFYSPGSGVALRERLGLKAPVIGFIGRLVEEKGIRLLLDAAKKLDSPASLLILGSGPLESELLRFQNETRIQLVHVPAVPHDAVRDYIRAMDMLVLPSFSTPRWKEQFGHVLIEAMACEVPVIGSTSAAIPEVIGDAGLLFQEGSSDDLLLKLKTLMDSPSECTRLGKLGRERVLARFTNGQVARQTVEFWKTL